MRATLAIQIGTFVVLGVMLLRHGHWRLGVAQLLLATVQAVLYTGDMA